MRGALIEVTSLLSSLSLNATPLTHWAQGQMVQKVPYSLFFSRSKRLFEQVYPIEQEGINPPT